MAQGTRVSGNLFHDNRAEDLFVEVDHGPFLVDNNLFLSPASLLSVSQGGAYVHNLIAGSLRMNPYDARQTPFHKAHSTELAGMHDNPCGDDKYFNNIFVRLADLSPYDRAPLAVMMEGNVFLGGARPALSEKRLNWTRPSIRRSSSSRDRADSCSNSPSIRLGPNGPMGR